MFRSTHHTHTRIQSLDKFKSLSTEAVIMYLFVSSRFVSFCFMFYVCIYRILSVDVFNSILSIYCAIATLAFGNPIHPTIHLLTEINTILYYLFNGTKYKCSVPKEDERTGEKSGEDGRGIFLKKH